MTAFYKKTRPTTGVGVGRDFYGRFSGGPLPPNLYGLGYKDLASRLFPGIESAEEVLMRHTLVGFYGRMLTPKCRSAWLFNLASYRPVLAEHWDSLLCGPLSVAAKAKKLLRFCPGCVDADLHDRGLAEWKVLHQLPFLTHCAEHGQLLLSSCAECGHCPTHQQFDYRVRSCRIVCNPRGYVNWSGRIENQVFDPELVIDVPAMADSNNA